MEIASAPAIEPLGGELGHLGEDLHLVGSLGVLCLQLQQREELGPCPALGVELAQLLSGFEIARRGREEPFEGGDRVLHVGELLAPTPGSGAEELGLLRQVDGDLGQLLLADEKVPEPPEVLVDAAELAESVRVLRLQVGDLGEGGDERLFVSLTIAVDAGDLAEDRDACLAVILRDPFQLLAKELSQREPGAALGVKTLQRRFRFGVVRVCLEQILVLLDRFRGVVG